MYPRLLIAALAGKNMLNVTINNSVKTSVDAGAAEYTNTQEDSASEELSFLATFTQLRDADTRQHGGNSDTSKETDSSAITHDEQQVETEHKTGAKPLSENELDTDQTDDGEHDGEVVSESSETDRAVNVLADSEQANNQKNQRSADDLLAQINAANQQKTAVTQYQAEKPDAQAQLTAKTTNDALKSGLQISKPDVKPQLAEEPVDKIVIPPGFRVMSEGEKSAEHQGSSQSTEGKGSTLSELAESKAKQNPTGELASQKQSLTDGQEKVSEPAVKPEKPLLQEHIEATDDVEQVTAQLKEQSTTTKIMPTTVQEHTSLAEHKQNTPNLKKSELAQEVSDIAKQIGAKVTQDGSGREIQVPAELKATLEQQLALLSPKERSALQQGLQQLSNQGKASPLVEQALQQLKELDEGLMAVTKQAVRSEVTVAASAAMANKQSYSYNSTKVDKDMIKQDMKESLKAMNSVDGGNFNSDIKREALSAVQLAQVMPTPQVEQLFKAIVTPAQTNPLSSQFSELAQYFEQLDAAPQSTQTQQLNATSHKVQVDAQMLQAVNIARNDAAKILQEKVSMMLNLNNQEAEIRLDPRELGSMQIRIRTDAEQAQVNFVVQNQQAKDLLEQSMPKLREMLAEQGIELGQSNIEQGGEGQQEQMLGSNEQGQAHSTSAEQSEQDENMTSRANGALNDGSSIDYYA